MKNNNMRSAKTWGEGVVGVEVSYDDDLSTQIHPHKTFARESSNGTHNFFSLDIDQNGRKLYDLMHKVFIVVLAGGLVVNDHQVVKLGAHQPFLHVGCCQLFALVEVFQTFSQHLLNTSAKRKKTKLKTLQTKQ